MATEHTPSSEGQATRSGAVRSIERLALKARMLRIAAAVASLVILVVVGFAIIASLDALIRFPALLRALMLSVLLALVAVDVRKFLVPALRFRPRPIEIAQRVEKQRPELAGHLASAVDFELSGLSKTNQLAAYAVRNLEELARGVEFGAVLRLRPALTKITGMALCMAATGWVAIAHPTTASIAARRVLLPWTEAAWPARTAIESLVRDGLVAPKGAPVSLRARLTMGDAANERVFVRYRMLDGAGAELAPWTEAALSRQPSGEFERLVDGNGDRIEYAFLTRDAETDVRAIRLVEPPRVVASRATVRAPGYAARQIAERTEDLGTGTDARSLLREPVLAGSTVRLELELSRPLEVDPDRNGLWAVRTGDLAEADQTKQPGVIEQGVGAPGGADAGVGSTDAGRRRLTVSAVGGDPTRWAVDFVAIDPMRIETQLVDADGIKQAVECAFVFDVTEDRPSTAAIIEPMQDESVVVDARVLMRAEFRDDIELRVAGMEIATRIGGSESDSLVLEEVATIGAQSKSGTLERTLEIGKLGVGPGDLVVLRAFSEDLFDGAGIPSASSHGRSRSASRTLRIVAEDEFERQIRSILSGVRREAMRIDERQADARETLASRPDGQNADQAAEQTVDQAQRAVTDGLGRMRDSLRNLLDRIERNRRESDSLADVARQAEEIAATSEVRSAEVMESLRRARGAMDEPGSEQERQANREKAREDAERQQDEVRAELEDLVALLDRDEDAWVVRRKLEGLTNRIRQLARETDQAAQRSAGESRDDLPPEAKAELDALAERQTKAAEEAERTFAEMKDRSRALAEADPEQAKALEAAAKEAEDGQVRDEMQQAARQTSENQLEQSKDAQDRALEALGRAAQALEADDKARAQELARLLEDLVASIKRLIAQTESSRAAVASVSDAADEIGLQAREPVAAGFGQLSQNTRGVAADARKRSREATRSARFLDSAAASMAAAAGGLRSELFRRADVDSATEAALARLDEALKEAEEAAEQAEDRAADERRDELIARYRDLLEKQIGVRDAAVKIAPAGGEALGRREVVESRRLGAAQGEVREALARVLEQDEDVRGSELLVEIHGEIDEFTASARARFLEAKPGQAIAPAEAAIEMLSSIIQSLDEEAAGGDEDMFAEQRQEDANQPGGAGGAGQGQAIPSSAEVKMLRSMQASLMRRTRALDESGLEAQSAARAEELAAIAARQTRILELGSRLAERIRGRNAPPTIIPPESGSESQSDDAKPQGDDGGNQP